MTISDNTTILLNDIQSLQVLEQEMFSTLEQNPNLTNEQRHEIVKKINQISQMRLNLYQTLASINKTYGQLLTESNENLKEQTMAVEIVENELNGAKKNLQSIQDENNNQVRLIEINNYYSQKYSHHSKIFRIVLLILIAFLLLFWLRKSIFLPNWLFTILFLLITIVGLWNLLPVLYTVWIRDNMYYQEYDWYFDASNAPAANTVQDNTDPWSSIPPGAICEGQECCDADSIYDPSRNICVINANYQCSSGNFDSKNSVQNAKNAKNAKNVIQNNTTSFDIKNSLSSGISSLATGVNNGVSRISNAVSLNYPEGFQNSCNTNPIFDALTEPEKQNRYKKPDATLGWSPEPSAGQSFVQFNGF